MGQSPRIEIGEGGWGWVGWDCRRRQDLLDYPLAKNCPPCATRVSGILYGAPDGHQYAPVPDVWDDQIEWEPAPTMLEEGMARTKLMVAEWVRRALQTAGEYPEGWEGLARPASSEW